MQRMKTLLTTILFGVLTTSVGYSKPGGWFFDILDRSSITVSSGYYAPARSYYQQPVYYQQPAPVYYQQPVYYYQQPVYQQRPSYNSGTYFRNEGCHYHNH